MFLPEFVVCKDAAGTTPLRYELLGGFCPYSSLILRF
jgi:hypothetical protein